MVTAAGLGSGLKGSSFGLVDSAPRALLRRLRNPGHQYQNIVPELGRDVQGLVTASRLCGPEPSSLDEPCCLAGEWLACQGDARWRRYGVAGLNCSQDLLS
jgi:hypothetical protein